MLGLFLLSLVTEQRLMAYSDPGFGAMFVQVVLVGVFGGIFRIRKLFSRLRRRKNEQPLMK